MAPDDDIQREEQVSREAQGLLAEYFRIRREYNSLDRNNPAHAPRRAALKERYFALDRKYTELIHAQQTLGTPVAGTRPRTRAEVLWEGALADEHIEERDLSPVDAEWIELNTPCEGRAADEVFEQALRTLDARDAGTAIAGDEPLPRNAAPGRDAPREPLAAEDAPSEEIAESEPGPADSLGDLDSPNLSAVSALRDIAQGLQHDDAGVPAAADSRPATPPERLQSTPVPAASAPSEPRRASGERAGASSLTRSAPPREREIACPSCGELLPAGTHVCLYCRARLIEGQEVDAEAPRHIAQTHLPAPAKREGAGIGPKLLVTLGWGIVLIGSTWLIVRGVGLEQARVDAWLASRGLEVLGRDQAGTILGISLVLLGITLVGAGVFAGRFVRLVVPLHELARAGRVETIEKLILRGEDIDPRDERGCTPLHFAVVARQPEVVAVLVGNGADPNAHNNRGDTPLHLAVANRDTVLVQYLIEKGADPEALNDSGATLMHVAAWVGEVGLLKIFMERGLRIDASTKAGLSPLHFAAQSGYVEATAFLLDHGAAADSASLRGTTPLFSAVRNGHLQVVQRLVEAGAEVNQRRSHDLETPLGQAIAHKRQEIAEYLRGRGAVEP